MTLCQHIDEAPGIKENNPFGPKRDLAHESMRARMTLRKVKQQGRSLLQYYCTTVLLFPHYTSPNTYLRAWTHETYLLIKAWHSNSWHLFGLPCYW